MQTCSLLHNRIQLLVIVNHVMRDAGCQIDVHTRIANTSDVLEACWPTHAVQQDAEIVQPGSMRVQCNHGESSNCVSHAVIPRTAFFLPQLKCLPQVDEVLKYIRIHNMAHMWMSSHGIEKAVSVIAGAPSAAGSGQRLRR